MKPKFFSICLMLLAINVSAFAQKTKPGEPVFKTVKVNEEFTSLLIENDLSVVLTESASDDITIEGDAKDVKKVEVRVADGRLMLAYARPQFRADVKVYVPAAFLNKVYINGKAMLSSAGVLHNKNLKILLSEEAVLNVKSFGKVSVETTGEIDFVSRMQPR